MVYDPNRHLRQAYERDLARWRARVRRAELNWDQYSDERAAKRLASARASMPMFSDYFSTKVIGAGENRSCLAVLLQLILSTALLVVLVVAGFCGAVMVILYAIQRIIFG